MATEAQLGGAEVCRGTIDFHSLPEGCIANVISFTSPRDACRLSLVSTTFRSAADSDAVWEKFLPSDYQNIISQSSLCFSSISKKQLYLSLCEKPLLIDEGKKSFLVDKLHGKKCYMLSARSLFIVWGDTPRYWRWNSVGGGEGEMGSVSSCRFAEVAELISVCWLEIRGWINTGMLSPSTLYAAYLVFKTTDGTYGFEYQPVEAYVGIAGNENPRRKVLLDAARGRRFGYRYVPRRAGISNRIRFVPVEVPRDEDVDVQQFAKERGDGWVEIELGDFFNEGGEEKEVEMGVFEVKGGDWKGGLIIQGIDIRPKLN